VMRKIELHRQERSGDERDELRERAPRKQQTRAQENENEIRDAEDHRQSAQNRDGGRIGRRQMKDRHYSGCNGVKERGLEHLVAFIWQRKGAPLLNVLNICEVVWRVVAGMERQEPGVVPEQNSPG